MRICPAVSAVLASLALGACAPQSGYQQPSSIQQLETQQKQLVDQMTALTIDPLNAFLREEPVDCKSANLTKAKSSSMIGASVVNPTKHGFDVVVTSGVTVLRVADGAKSRRCKDVARELYEFVVSTYIGSGYSGLRDRARIGLDDLRAMP